MLKHINTEKLHVKTEFAQALPTTCSTTIIRFSLGLTVDGLAHGALVDPGPELHAQGKDLQLEIPISFEQAALGADINSFNFGRKSFI